MLIKYIDLCCGIGGFRVGINQFQKEHTDFKFECVFSADVKADAIKTYNLNFKETMTKTDVHSIETLPDFDLLCAGFPCQPFSSAGNKNGFSDERGGMIFKIADLCEKYKPRHFILENVSNLLSLDKGKIIQRIQELFGKLGYQVTYKKLNSSDFGVPQSRERVYIVGDLLGLPSLEKIKKKEKRVFKDATDYDSKYTDIPQDLCRKIIQLHTVNSVYGVCLQDKRGGTKNIHSWDLGYNGEISAEERKLMKTIMTERRKKHWAKEKKIVWMDGMPLTLTEIQTFYDHDDLENMLDNLIEKRYLRLEKCKDLVNGKRQYKEDSEVGYNICKGKLSFPISRILDPADVCPTLTATDSCKLVVMIDNKYIRKLTDKELKRVCGFPEDFQIPKDVDTYDLFGNMVTPPVIKGILEQIFTF